MACAKSGTNNFLNHLDTEFWMITHVAHRSINWKSGNISTFMAILELTNQIFEAFEKCNKLIIGVLVDKK